MVINKKIITKSERFLNPINNNPNYILFEVGNLNSDQTSGIRESIENLNFSLKMTLKRLIDKKFLGERKKNQKCKFSNRVYMVIPREDAKYEQLISVIKKYKANIVGVVNNGNMVENYEAYLMCSFNKTKLMSMLAQILLFPPLITINHLTNKLTSK